MKKIPQFRREFTFVIALLFISVGVTSSTGTTDIKQINVPADSGNILYVGGSGPGNYTMIQDAIDDASDGDTVFVYDDSSPYHENVLVDKSINLVGEKRDTTIIDGNMSGYVFFVIANNITISRFTIRNSGKSRTYRDAGISIRSNYNTIIDNFVSNNRQGIYLDRSNYNIIRDNIIISNKGDGMELDDSSNYNIVSGNIITLSKGDGMELDDSSNYNIVSGNNITLNDEHGIRLYGSSNNNIVTRNYITYNKGSGIFVFGYSSNTIITDNTISNSYYGLKIFDNSSNNNISSNIILDNDHGIRFEGSWENNIKGNTITNDSVYFIYSINSTITDNTIIDGHISLHHSSNNTITNNNINRNIYLYQSNYNTIKGNILSKANIGIIDGIDLRYSNYNNITGNTISNKWWGIHLGDSSNYNTITGNTISKNICGIFVYEFSNYNTITGNTISKNRRGIQIVFCSNNIINNNNFITNIRHVSFCHLLLKFYDITPMFSNRWNGNYWGRPRLLPKPIFGWFVYHTWRWPLPWVQFDWHPASEPYDIGM